MKQQCGLREQKTQVDHAEVRRLKALEDSIVLSTPSILVNTPKVRFSMIPLVTTIPDGDDAALPPPMPVRTHVDDAPCEKEDEDPRSPSCTIFTNARVKFQEEMGMGSLRNFFNTLFPNSLDL